MIDGVAKRIINPMLERIAAGLVRIGVTPDYMTWLGFVLGLGAAAAISGGALLAGAMLILASRLCDGLDGAVARQSRGSDFGGYLDIVLDFAFYGVVPLAFAILNPAANALPALVLLLSFYVNGASFLAFATLAEKRSLSSDARGPKAFYFTTGLAEAGETLAVFVAACLFPGWFAVLAYGFAAVCFMTTASRIALARRMFRD